MVIFRCDGTYEGILTAVFSGYRSDDVMIECDNDNMFCFRRMYGGGYGFVKVLTGCQRNTKNLLRGRIYDISCRT